MGWGQNERFGFIERAKDVDALLALAFEHHLVIANNIPILNFVEWIISISKRGIMKFVPKNDGAVKELLKSREDIFIDYSYKFFKSAFLKHAKIINETSISKSGRVLLEYDASR